jgi:hypothetical protein
MQSYRKKSLPKNAPYSIYSLYLSYLEYFMHCIHLCIHISCSADNVKIFNVLTSNISHHCICPTGGGISPIRTVLVDFRQSSLKVIFKLSRSLRTCTFFTDKKLFQQDFMLLIFSTKTPQGIPKGHLERSRWLGTCTIHKYIIQAVCERMLIKCHTNMIMGNYLSDKTH